MPTEGIKVTKHSFTLLFSVALAAMLLPTAPAIAQASCMGQSVTISGTDGNDRIEGTAQADVIAGFAGNDVIIGLDGDDHICGGPGSDSLAGSKGDDVLDGGSGDDQAFGAAGRDRILGRSGHDRLRGGKDDDELVGHRGSDSMKGGQGPDLLDGRRGHDANLFGADGSDRVLGRDGNDLLRGGESDDHLMGHGGADRLQGGKGNDRLEGGDGNDTNIGGPGVDVCTSPGAAESTGCEGPEGGGSGRGTSQLIYSTYLGGNASFDSISDLAVDDTGAVITAGTSSSADFPTGASGSAGRDVAAFPFVVKFSRDASELEYVTTLGEVKRGGGDAGATDMALDATGNAYVTGFIEDNSLRSTVGAFQESSGGAGDAFAAKVSPTGAIVYATYIGSSGNEQAFGIDVDAQGNAYVAGITNSTTFPTTEGAYDTTLDGPSDAFVVKIGPEGDRLEYSTFVGGSSAEGLADPDRSGDAAADVEVDGTGAAHLTGITKSDDFPVSPDAPQPQRGRGFDGFVTKLTTAGDAVTFSTYLGGNARDLTASIALNPDGSPVVVGQTQSRSFPTTTGAFQVRYGGAIDGFVTRVSGTGDRFAYSTFMGGEQLDRLAGVHSNRDGSVFFVGTTVSVDYPVTDDAFDPFPPRDVLQPRGGTPDTDQVIGHLSANGTRLRYNTYLGGMGSKGEIGWDSDFSPGDDRAQAVDVVDGDVVIGGASSANNFPTTPGVVQPRRIADLAPSAQGQATISRLSPGGPPCTHPGTRRADDIRGTRANDLICGLGGRDDINARGGSDIVYGESGGDEIRTGSGWDVVYGGAGHDRIFGNKGDDALYGRTGRDTVHTGPGSGEFNRIDEVASGDAGHDRIYGGPEQDDLIGGSGRDRMWGGKDADALFGGGAADVLRGGDHHDYLDGQQGDDILYGGPDSDRLIGGPGVDSCFGGAGNDSLRRCE